jgi:hypothetical protein
MPQHDWAAIENQKIGLMIIYEGCNTLVVIRDQNDG